MKKKAKDIISTIFVFIFGGILSAFLLLFVSIFMRKKQRTKKIKKPKNTK